MTSAPVHAEKPLLLRESQVARLLSISTRTLRRWVSGQRFPQPIRLRGDLQRAPAMWLRSEVEAWVQTQAEAR